MDFYETEWKPRSEAHDREAHIENRENPTRDPSCPKCYNRNIFEPPLETYHGFNLFWEWYSFIFHAIEYNTNTLNEFGNALLIERNIQAIRDKGEIDLEDPQANELIIHLCDCITRIMESMRYSKAPDISRYQAWQIIIPYLREINLTLKILRENDWRMNWEEIEEILKRKSNEVSEEIIEERFQRFWTWYQTIIPVRQYNEETKEHFRALLELEDEVTHTTNPSIRNHLKRIISSITYVRYDNLDKEDLLLQIVERFIYSKSFRLNEEETEENKEQILKTSSQENSEKNTPEENTPEENTPQENTPEENTPENQTPEILSPKNRIRR